MALVSSGANRGVPAEEGHVALEVDDVRVQDRIHSDFEPVSRLLYPGLVRSLRKATYEAVWEMHHVAALDSPWRLYPPHAEPLLQDALHFDLLTSAGFGLESAYHGFVAMNYDRVLDETGVRMHIVSIQQYDLEAKFLERRAVPAVLVACSR